MDAKPGPLFFPPSFHAKAFFSFKTFLPVVYYGCGTERVPWVFFWVFPHFVSSLSFMSQAFVMPPHCIHRYHTTIITRGMSSLLSSHYSFFVTPTISPLPSPPSFPVAITSRPHIKMLHNGYGLNGNYRHFRIADPRPTVYTQEGNEKNDNHH